VELSQHGWLHVSKDDRDADMADDAELLQREFNAAVEFWPTERVRASLNSPLYFTGIHFKRGFTIHPLNYALGLAKAAEAAGARIYENSPVVEIDPAGVRKRVITPTARVRASHIVLAGSVHLGDLMPRIGRTLFPISTYVITTAPLGPKLHEAIRYAGAVSDTDLADNHYRIVGGDRLMWSGRNTLWRGEPRRYVAGLLADLARAYPQLAQATADYAWTGMLGNTVHRMPQVGEVSPGVWLLSGFGSLGINTTAMGGQMIARAIVEGDQGWQLFAPFELVWAGGPLGRATLQAYYWSYRARERLASVLARRREAERRRIEDEVRAAVAVLGEPVAARPAAAAKPPPLSTPETAPAPSAQASHAQENGPAAAVPAVPEVASSAASPPEGMPGPDQPISETSSAAEAQTPKAGAAAEPQSKSPQKRLRWFARLSRRSSSDEPPGDPPSPAPDKPAQHSAG
jgi:glycine/D-amino acid oxidase-like deaminating enzyme